MKLLHQYILLIFLFIISKSYQYIPPHRIGINYSYKCNKIKVSNIKRCKPINVDISNIFFTKINMFNQIETNFNRSELKKSLWKLLLLGPLTLLLFSKVSFADDELARYAAEGNKVGVDATCFIRKCALETTQCANDPNCLKGLSCLAR